MRNLFGFLDFILLLCLNLFNTFLFVNLFFLFWIHLVDVDVIWSIHVNNIRLNNLLNWLYNSYWLYHLWIILNSFITYWKLLITKDYLVKIKDVCLDILDLSSFNLINTVRMEPNSYKKAIFMLSMILGFNFKLRSFHFTSNTN
jgi:hypothetical protein